MICYISTSNSFSYAGVHVCV